MFSFNARRARWVGRNEPAGPQQDMLARKCPLSGQKRATYGGAARAAGYGRRPERRTEATPAPTSRMTPAAANHAVISCLRATVLSWLPSFL